MKRKSIKKIVSIAVIAVMAAMLILPFAACSGTTYTVTFNTGGGTAVAAQEVKSGKTASRPDTDPTREGYIFDDWYKEAALTTVFNFSAEKIEADTTVYAKLAAITYSIAYNANGGEGTMANSSHTYDSAKTLSTNAFTKAGYVFAGWNTAADGSGTSYAVGLSVNNLTATNGATITLYARWTLQENDGLEGHYSGYGEWADSENSRYWYFDITLDGWGNGTVIADYSADGETWASFLESYFEGLEGPCPFTYTLEDERVLIRIDGEAYGDFDITVMENGSLYIIIFAIEAELVKSEPAPDAYTVSFNTDGGGSIAPQSVETGEAASRPATDPEKTGYTFAGWYKDSAKTTVFDFSAETIDANTTVYAKWAAHTYTVVYNANGGTGTAMESSSHTYDVSKALSLNIYIKDTYYFAGWNTAADGSGASYTNGQSVTNLSAADGGTVALYAKWQKTPIYKVSFDTDGGSSIGMQYITEGGAATRPSPDPYKAGYTFYGWYTGSDKTVMYNFSGAITVDTVLYAKFVANTYTVAYNANGGTGTAMTSSPATYGAGLTLTANTYARAGYTFDGWNTAANGSGTNYADAQEVSNLTEQSGATVTLYAQWRPDSSLKVSFDTDGGSSIASQYVTSGGNAAAPATNPTRTGYTFAGWFSDSGKTTAFDFAGAAVTSNITVYAKWIAHTYTVAYDRNGATGTSTSTAHTYGIASSITTTTVSRTSYTFLGWCEDINGNGTLYARSASVTNLTSENGATVTLYAIWQLAAYTATLQKNDGSGDTIVNTFIYADGFYVPNGAATFQREGYSFLYWTTSASGTVQREEGYKYTAGTTLYARWQLNVTFVLNGGTLENTPLLNIGDTFTQPADPVRTGYAFEGWYTDSNFTTAYVFNGTVTAPITLYAKWASISYTIRYDANGGSGDAMTDTVHSAGSGVALTTNSYVKEGYIFAGWNTAADGSGISFGNHEMIEYSFERGATITLYAQW